MYPRFGSHRGEVGGFLRGCQKPNPRFLVTSSGTVWNSPYREGNILRDDIKIRLHSRNFPPPPPPPLLPPSTPPCVNSRIFSKWVSFAVVDSKCDYPAACNSMETLLIHEKLVRLSALEKVIAALKERGVRFTPPHPHLIHLSSSPTLPTPHLFGRD